MSDIDAFKAIAAMNAYVLNNIEQQRRDTFKLHTRDEVSEDDSNRHRHDQMADVRAKNTQLGARIVQLVRENNEIHGMYAIKCEESKKAGIMIAELHNERAIEREVNKELAENLSKHKGLVFQIAEAHEIQGSDGNWNANDYMLGMFNSMEFCLAILEDRDVNYRQLKAAEPDPILAAIRDAHVASPKVQDGSTEAAEDAFVRGYNRGCGDTKLECEQEKASIYSKLYAKHRENIADKEEEITKLTKELEFQLQVCAKDKNVLRKEVQDIADQVVKCGRTMQALREENEQLRSFSADCVLLNVLRHKRVFIRYNFTEGDGEPEHGRVMNFNPEMIARAGDGRLLIVGNSELSDEPHQFTADQIDAWEETT